MIEKIIKVKKFQKIHKFNMLDYLKNENENYKKS
jgi:hypothetical protein